MIPREKLMAETNRLRARTAKFLADIVACPSHSGTEKRVADRIRTEMKAVGFDEAFIDKLGDAIGCPGPRPSGAPGLARTKREPCR